MGIIELALKELKVNKKDHYDIIPIILSGGDGTRLWPLSRSSYPKQYLNLEEDNIYTMLQNTFLRISGVKDIKSPIIICNESHRFIVAEQMRNIGVRPEAILLEPIGRNTAPAIALAAMLAKEKFNDPMILVLSADHKIQDNKKFINAIEKGKSFASQNHLVTFGVLPNYPATGYGYIESFDLLTNKVISSKIKNFIEKPDKLKATQLIKDKHFSWNSGIFLFKTSTYLEELAMFQPDIVDVCNSSLKEAYRDLDFLRINKNIFEKCPNISIDNAVMEKTKHGIVVSLDAGWDDIGTWEALSKTLKKDKNDNSFKGNIFVKDVENSYLRSESRLLVGLGIKDLFVIETDDTVLIAHKKSVHKTKDLVKELEKMNFNEAKFNRKVNRPWGNYLSIIEDKKWLVKRIEINPKECISLQKHHHRSEHWIVVNGEAKVEIDKNISFLKENESTYIPLGAVHRLSNPGDKQLVIIEVQSGDYLSEDDIVRFEDKYKRTSV